MSLIGGTQKTWRPKDKVLYSKSAADKAVELENRKDRLLASNVFEELSDKRVEELVMLMEEADFKEGEYLCKIRDPSDCFWYIRKGEVDVISGEGKKLATLPKGVIAGEIGMIRNVTRTATLRCTKASVIMRINRSDYNAVVEKQRLLTESPSYSALMNTGLFKGWTSRLTMTVMDVTKVKKFKAGDVIMRKGDLPDFMYIIEEGGVLVDIESDPPAKGFQVSLGPGRYFGEKALLNDGVRGNTVSADSAGCRCLALDKKSFAKYFLATKAKFEFNIMSNERNMQKNDPTKKMLTSHGSRRGSVRNNVLDYHPVGKNNDSESSSRVSASGDEVANADADAASGETHILLNPVRWLEWVPGIGAGAAAGPSDPALEA